MISQHNFVTKLFSIKKFLHSLLPFLLKTSLLPFSSTQPTILPGFPTTNAKSGTSFVTTDPAPIREY